MSCFGGSYAPDSTNPRLPQQVELPKFLNGILSAVADVYVLKLAALLFGSTAGGLAVSIPDLSHQNLSRQSLSRQVGPS